MRSFSVSTPFSPVPALYIQGKMDAQRGGGNGMDVVAMFTAIYRSRRERRPIPFPLKDE